MTQFRLARAARALMLAAAVLLLAPAAAPARSATPEQIAQYLESYDYDHAAPLNAELSPQSDSGTYTVHSLVFDSVNGERVPALLFLPANGAPAHPCVVFMHGYGGDKSMANMFAPSLTGGGMAVLAIDAQYHGERKQPGKNVLTTDADNNRAAFHQSIMDLRRAVDYLETRDDIDATRIGFLGVSMGSFMGAVFAGADARVKTALFIVGGGGWDEFFANSQVPPIVAIREHCGKTGAPLAIFADSMQSVDALHFVGLMAPRPMLMINCSDDIIVPKLNAELQFEAAGEPKYIEWFKCGGSGHIPPPGKTQILIGKWFKKNL
jgi:cephalosporin-C deacetylase-like acetyl esterase